MRSRGIWIGFLLLILLFSCNVKRYKFEKKVEEFNQKACHGVYCAEVNLKYPIFLGKSQSTTILNNLIEKQVVIFLEPFEQKQEENIKSAATNFLDAYLGFMEDFESSQEWEINLDANVTFENEKVISIVFETYSFTGGAHPNSFRQYLNFDKQRNVKIENDSLIVDKQLLLEITEFRFREVHQIKKGMTLSETNMFFLDANDKFFLPTAIGYEMDSLVLFYNTYEIGPYVMGTTEIKFAKSDLEGIVRLFK